MAEKIPKTQVSNGTTPSPQQVSKKTFGNQNILPRLPVPDLHKTCGKFVEWVQPLLSEEEFTKTKQIVDEFQSPGGGGEKLQKELIKWSQRSDISNWLEPLWDDMYLKSRSPVAISKNFSIVCEENPIGLNQVQRSAALILSALKFKSLIDKEELEVDQERGQPVCMMQFKRLFSATRIPKREIDQLRSPNSTDNPTSGSEKHIVVFCKGQIFAMDVLTESGELRSSKEIEKDLNTILRMGKEKAEEGEGLGILTTMNRDEWSDARDALLRIHPQNEASLETIETSLFALCLEDSSPDTPEDLFRTMLHGDGRNRWFDKSFQFIVCENGKFGVNGEHSGLDGYPVHKLIKFIHQDSGKAEGHEGGTIRNQPRRLEFYVNDELQKIIIHAFRSFHSFINDTRIKIFEFGEFGKEYIKRFKVSPDAFVQLALQLAQHKLFSKCKSTYESATTRRFLHGRTETLRSVSLEAVQFVENMVSACYDDHTKAMSLNEAAQKHVTTMMGCMAGMGVERHLFGLLTMFERFGSDLGIHSVPKIFTDRGWTRLGHDTLSTTSMPDPHGVVLSGFGPVVDDGFGIVYLIGNDSILFTITSRSHMEHSLKQFAANVTESLLEMSALMKRVFGGHAHNI